MTITETEIINIALSSITALTAIISIIIAIITLKRNSKMIEESTRPNIVIYSTMVDSITYIIIKNYGSSSAIIDSLQCDYEFSKEETGDFEGDIFELVNGAILAPNQSIRRPLIGWELKQFDFHFKIKYHSSTHNYHESTTVKIKANTPYGNMNSSKKDELTALQNIYLTILEMLKREL